MVLREEQEFWWCQTCEKLWERVQMQFKVIDPKPEDKGKLVPPCCLDWKHLELIDIKTLIKAQSKEA